MKNLKMVDYNEAEQEVRETYDHLKKKIGMVPNLYKTTANSPIALQAILEFGNTLRRGDFNREEIEAISLAVSQENNCKYCLAAHTAVGKKLGFTEEETIHLRKAVINDTRLRALTRLAKEITVSKGYPSQELIDDFYEVEYSKAALVELIGIVSLMIFNNYLDHITEIPIDFPSAPELKEKENNIRTAHY